MKESNVTLDEHHYRQLIKVSAQVTWWLQNPHIRCTVKPVLSKPPLF